MYRSIRPSAKLVIHHAAGEPAPVRRERGQIKQPPGRLSQRGVITSPVTGLLACQEQFVQGGLAPRPRPGVRVLVIVNE